MQVKQQLYIFLVLVLERFIAADKCPPNENIVPCTCKNIGSKAYVTCVELQNAEQLREALAGVKGLKLYSLEVQDSYMGDVPGYMFKDTNFEQLKWKNTKLTSIGDDKDPPYAGLENSLQSLTVIEAFWDYDKPLTKVVRMDHLKKLTYLNSENNIIPKLGNDWFAHGPVSLKDLYIQSSLTKEVGDKVFTQLKNLRTLHFTGNSVTLQRSALPPNPIYMDSLDLSENEIKELPSDLFTKLPALKYLYLSDNALERLPENTFKTILRQLDFLFVSSNPFDCGPEMKWIFNDNLQEKIIGTCATPEVLSGREIDSLTADDISG